MTHINPFTRVERVLHYHGEPVYLAGKYPSTPTLGVDALPGIDYEPVMRQLAALRNNFTRHWIIPYWLYGGPGNAYSPFQRAADGRWDVTRFNDDYFRRLGNLVRAALHHGVVVQLTIFDTSGLETGAGRWENNPYNDAKNVNPFLRPVAGDGSADGVPAFYDLGIPGLADAQKALVDRVVGATMGYWNVVYEIMNEVHSGIRPVDQPQFDMAALRRARVKWLDTVTGWIDAKTPDTRLVFHNDYTAPEQSASDVVFWKQNRATYTRYPLLHGVTFHNNPRNVDPAAERYREFNTEKVFQVSTDAYDGDREDFAWNRETTRIAFSRKQLFQAEAVEPAAARGIGQAAPSPTDLRLGRFTHLFRASGPNQPQLDMRFFVNSALGFYITYNPVVPYGEMGRGRVEDFRFTGETQEIRLYNRGGNTTDWWRYTFAGDVLTLVNTRTSFTFTLQRIRRAPVEALVPFLYNWQRIWVSNTSPHFEMRFDVDGAVRTFRRTPGYQEMDYQDVRSVTPANETSGTMAYYNHLQARLRTYRYAFENAGARLRLFNVENGVQQLFERRDWYIPPTNLTVTAALAESAMEPAGV
jgi:hypothetical protein